MTPRAPGSVAVWKPSHGWRSGWLAGLLAAAALAAAAPQAAAARLHRFWPRFPRAQRVLTTTPVPSPEYGILLATLAGLSARPDEHNKPREVVWLPADHPAYERLLKEMVLHTGAAVEPPQNLWTLVDRFRKRGIVRGYVLYRYDLSDRPLHSDGPMDVSVNVATALCAPLGAVAVSEALEAEAKGHGLTRLADARDLTEATVLDRYGSALSRSVLASIDPKVAETRAEAVAMGAFVAAHPGPIYERALARLKPDSPVLGWGAGDEALQTAPASRWAAFQTATNWCTNLALLASEEPGRTYPEARLRPEQPRSIWDLRWEDGVSYVAFLMSDGDNVQWAMGNFLEGEDSWWSSPVRGDFPMGWTIPYVDLAQLSPYTLDRLYTSATAKDDFTLLGGGYYYPDLFGTSRKTGNWMLQHARRIGPYMATGRVSTLMVNLQSWDGAEAQKAYRDYAGAIAGLEGILTVQYYPYTAGAGRVLWVRRADGAEIPVVSARFSIWAQTGRAADTTPTKVAAMLNALPHEGPMAEARFSWVVAHAWSYFRQPDPNAEPGAEEVEQALGAQPGVARGLLPVRWCVDALDPHVRVLTPTDLVRIMRLRVHTKDTLTAALDELSSRCVRSRKTLSSVAFAANHMVGQARREMTQGRYRHAFELGRKAHGVLRAAGLWGPP